MQEPEEGDKAPQLSLGKDRGLGLMATSWARSVGGRWPEEAVWLTHFPLHPVDHILVPICMDLD